MKIAHYILSIVLAFGVGVCSSFLHFATALGALNLSQTARGIGLTLAVLFIGLSVVTSLFGFPSLRRTLLIVALAPIALLDTYLALRSMPVFAWPLIFLATAAVAWAAILLSGRIYDHLHSPRKT